ncbi:hypothetical protein GCM10010123_40710 [Pilimelia anulata]|uniref:SCP2 domain-containing protein n=1 Tax=Pilimelia anulata TaxID=53371 RepID=A0A8J3BIU0_9ACTN|nr:SCP2 sterol-binding domain-containing protein [Pilimelia anulata]GGK06826.1 hypothetical protein GCM10010123_40710 [Pilimelia anulata]
MSDVTTAFFEELAESGYEPMLRRATGTIRFDLESDDRVTQWMVAIDHGVPAVSRKKGRADCVVRADAALFDKVVTGEANTVAAMLRGRIAATSEKPELLVLFQRYLRARALANRPESGRKPAAARKPAARPAAREQRSTRSQRPARPTTTGATRARRGATR